MIPIFDRSESGNSPLRNITAEPLNTKPFNGNGGYPAKILAENHL